MALQPAAGVRDLNPRQVEENRAICITLANLYRCWGYQEVAPPMFERLDTLAAGGGIATDELVRLVADDPLGLRPELTASIARAACTRLAAQPRPLRLWAEGVTFRSSTADGGHQRIQEQLQSGVELLGEPAATADVELMRMLLASASGLGLGSALRPQLLVGHHGLLTALLDQLPGGQQSQARRALTEFDPLALQELPLCDDDRSRLVAAMRLRGDPGQVLSALEACLGPIPLIAQLSSILEAVLPAARRAGVTVRLDPSFQPHFALYDGLVLKLVCQGPHGPVAVASGGRYDALVGRFSDDRQQAAGVGFGFDVGAVRELFSCSGSSLRQNRPTILVTYAREGLLASAFDAIERLHLNGNTAELHSGVVADEQAAQRLATERGCQRAEWISS